VQRDYFPFGSYSITEMSMIGATEQQLTAQRVAYEIGLAHLRKLRAARSWDYRKVY
jgi:NAD(P) transhydrogenase